MSRKLHGKQGNAMKGLPHEKNWMQVNRSKFVVIPAQISTLSDFGWHSIPLNLWEFKRHSVLTPKKLGYYPWLLMA